MINMYGVVDYQKQVVTDLGNGKKKKTYQDASREVIGEDWYTRHDMFVATKKVAKELKGKVLYVGKYKN